MDKKEILKNLKSNKQNFKSNFHLAKIGLFGSFARGEAANTSDIDIIVKFDKPIGWDFIILKEYLEDILNREVDLVTEEAIKLQMKKGILKEVIYI